MADSVSLDRLWTLERLTWLRPPVNNYQGQFNAIEHLIFNAKTAVPINRRFPSHKPVKAKQPFLARNQSNLFQVFTRSIETVFLFKRIRLSG